jgi:hypothetical protein
VPCYSYPTLADLVDDAVVAEGATDETTRLAETGSVVPCYSYPTLADLVDDAVVAEGATDEVSHC